MMTARHRSSARHRHVVLFVVRPFVCRGSYIMAPTTGAYSTLWSTCSVVSANAALDSFQCLLNTPTAVWGVDPVCGNGVVEADEACDCGATDCRWVVVGGAMRVVGAWWLVGWLVGWLVCWLVGWMDDGRMDGWTDAWVGGWKDGRADGQQ